MRNATRDVAMVVYQYIIDYKRQNNGNSPSVSKIEQGTGLERMTAWRSTKRLEELGLLTYDEDSGGFIVPDSKWTFDLPD